MFFLQTTRRRSTRLNNSGNSAHSRNSSELNEPKNPRRQSSRLRSLRANEVNQNFQDLISSSFVLVHHYGGCDVKTIYFYLY
jgi:hypothetical protein